MKPCFLTLLFSAALFAQASSPGPTSIDAGLATEPDCATADLTQPNAFCVSGGIPYSLPTSPTPDATLRFSSSVIVNNVSVGQPFTYKIAAVDRVPYVIDLAFIEPSSLPPARKCNVFINDRLVWPNLVMKGTLVPFTRTSQDFSVDGVISIRFETVTRSCVISSITVTPLLRLEWLIEQLQALKSAETPGFQLVQAKCTRCHQANGKLELFVNGIRQDHVGGLDTSSISTMLRGGRRGAAIVPGNPDESLMYRYASIWQLGPGPGGNSPIPSGEQLSSLLITSDAGFGLFRYLGPSDDWRGDEAMPPFWQLTQDELRTLRDWIAAGAKRWAL